MGGDHHPDHSPGEGPRRRGPPHHGRGASTTQFFTNWRDYEGPITKKLGLTVRNRFLALGLLKGCCGHPGEPGC
jgi:hypothetical protein